MKIRLLAATVVAASIAVGGCGEGSTTPMSEKSTPTQATGATAGAVAEKPAAPKPDRTLRTGQTDYGKILQDGRRRTLYVFTRDSSKSRCYGECAVAWPPVIVNTEPRAKRGAKASLIGTVKRRNGKLQATYDGQPLYFYVGETQPNQVLCQAVPEFGGTWYIVNPDGTAKT